jgi:hypothetical protein
MALRAVKTCLHATRGAVLVKWIESRATARARHVSVTNMLAAVMNGRFNDLLKIYLIMRRLLINFGRLSH